MSYEFDMNEALERIKTGAQIEGKSIGSQVMPMLLYKLGYSLPSHAHLITSIHISPLHNCAPKPG